MSSKTKLLIAGVIIVAIVAVITFDLFLRPKPKKQESNQQQVTQVIEEPQKKDQQSTETIRKESEAPAKSASTIATQNAPAYYTIQSGDTYALIAKKKYGDSRCWKIIADANPQYKPKSLPIGKKIIIPPGPQNKIKGANSINELPDMHDRAEVKSQRTYTVQPGDSLWEIAKKYNRNDVEGTMQKIIDANMDKLSKNKEVLKPGWVLVIPE